MKIKHSQSAWETDDNNKIIDYYGNHVCVIDTQNEQWEVNREVIEQSPKLLESCLEIRKLFKYGMHFTPAQNRALASLNARLDKLENNLK